MIDLVQHNLRDEKSGNDQKDVDPNVPGRHEANLGVVKNNQKNCQASQPVDVGSKFHSAGGYTDTKIAYRPD
jgi:hypothetical protein